VYDGGQLVTGTMMDYAVPKADQLPNYETGRTETPTPVNPLGIKGAGETGTIAATPAVVNAVVDALAGFGVDHIEAMPLTSERVWQTIQTAKAKK
jgi:carbon-monoxide dehydrogenase large subunit